MAIDSEGWFYTGDVGKSMRMISQDHRSHQGHHCYGWWQERCTATDRETD